MCNETLYQYLIFWRIPETYGGKENKKQKTKRPIEKKWVILNRLYSVDRLNGQELPKVPKD